jgi:branched-chain amino acid aminotransferase
VIVLLNGQFLPEEKAVLSVFDRGFLYGDGLFETMRVYGGKPFRWQQHMERLRRGAEFLNLRLPFVPSELRQFAAELVARNGLPEAILRLTLSRGVGPRGYSTKGADKPNLVMTLHPVLAIDPQNPPRWKLITASLRVPAHEKLSTFKTCNKLPQILARTEAESQEADEALLLNTNGDVAEAASSNLFWIEDGKICTTPLASGILAGVTRDVVFEICERLGMRVQEIAIQPETLLQAQGVFLSLSTLGIVEVLKLDDHDLRRSPATEKIRFAYEDLMRNETA